jgi:hypothetical protein
MYQFNRFQKSSSAASGLVSYLAFTAIPLVAGLASDLWAVGLRLSATLKSMTSSL